MVDVLREADEVGSHTPACRLAARSDARTAVTDVSRCWWASSAAFLPFSVDETAEPEGRDASHADTLTGCRFTRIRAPRCREGSKAHGLFSFLSFSTSCPGEV